MEGSDRMSERGGRKPGWSLRGLGGEFLSTSRVIV